MRKSLLLVEKTLRKRLKMLKNPQEKKSQKKLRAHLSQILKLHQSQPLPEKQPLHHHLLNQPQEKQLPHLHHLNRLQEKQLPHLHHQNLQAKLLLPLLLHQRRNDMAVNEYLL